MGNPTTNKGRETEVQPIRNPESLLVALEESLEWARHEIDTKFHAVKSYAGGSVQTLCEGRWAVRGERWDAEARPPIADRCERCQILYAERRLARTAEVVRGLIELRDAVPVEIANRFDTSDEGSC